MNKREIIIKVIQKLLQSKGGKEPTFFQENIDSGLMFQIKDGPDNSKLIAISGTVEGPTSLASSLGISNDILIQAFEWIGDGQTSCSFKENTAFYEVIISTDESLWPNNSMLSNTEIIKALLKLITEKDEYRNYKPDEIIKYDNIPHILDQPTNISSLQALGTTLETKFSMHGYMSGELAPHSLAEELGISLEDLFSALKSRVTRNKGRHSYFETDDKNRFRCYILFGLLNP